LLFAVMLPVTVFLATLKDWSTLAATFQLASPDCEARTVTVPVRVEMAGNSLTASGKTTLAQKAFGIEPVSAGGGTVKVKNELGIEFKLVGRI